VFDVDEPENLPDWLCPLLDRAVFLRTSSDTDSRRGHYVYRQRLNDQFGNGLGKLKPPKGKKWGQIRGYGGGLVLAPTVHPRDGGTYTAVPAQPIPYVPGEIAAKLNAVADAGDYRPLSFDELDANAKAFLSAYIDERETYALTPILAAFDPTPVGRHASMWDAVCWALREAKAGRFSAQTAVDELRDRWNAAVDGGARDPDEFNRMVRDAVPLADEASADELWARAHRHRWPHPRQPQKVAQEVMARAKRDSRPLAHWRGEWYQWNGRCWNPTNDDQIRQMLYQLLEHANYEHSSPNGVRVEAPWNPDKAKLTNVIDALKAEALWADAVEDGAWSDGRKHRVVPFANGLLRVDDLTLLEHTPDYFNIDYIRCSYDPDAELVTGNKFLDDLTDSDPEAIAALMEFVGTRLVGDDRYQKMLIVVGPSGSGKGTFDRLLSKMLGRKHAGVRMDDYRNNGFPIEPLLGKTLVTFSDQRAHLDMKRFTDLLLQVVGGDAVSLRIPYAKRSVSLRLPLTFIILSNETPVLPDNAGALLRRVITIKTPNTFAGREDYDLDTKLADELPAFVNLALMAYQRLVERGRFVQPESGREILGMLRENSSYLANFVDECCDVGPKLCAPKVEVYTRWKMWCQANGHTPTAANKFASDLYSLYLPAGQRITQTKRNADGGRVPCFGGLALKGGTLKLAGLDHV
jgi:P4 family phage/plasmid primase-like protien